MSEIAVTFQWEKSQNFKSFLNEKNIKIYSHFSMGTNLGVISLSEHIATFLPSVSSQIMLKSIT